MDIIAFVIFAIIFCHFMNKWSQGLEELETDVDPSNVVVGHFIGAKEPSELKRVA